MSRDGRKFWGSNGGQTPPMPAVPQRQIDISQCESIICQAKHISLGSEETICGHDRFTTGFMLKKVPALLSGQPQDQIVPIEFFVCDKCGAPTTIYKRS